IDGGLARISRYVPRTKVQRLPIEKISQASARQRAGRCGREGPGICERLYTETDFNTRPAFTEPEIRRTGLAAVVLQMLAAGLGDIESFPFPDPPQARLVTDAWRLLQELSAVEEDGTLTEDGRRLAQLPLDPRLGAMLLAADRLQCLKEVLIITAALSINDPRERPPEARGAADAAHAAFADARSDFLAYLKLFEAYEAARAAMPRRKLAAWCREHFLAPQRMREWREVARQLGELCERLGLAASGQAAEYDAIHKALLAGFVGNLARRDDDGGYQGCRGLRYRLHPSSTLARRPPDWVMAAEVAETRQHYGRDAARVQPAWVEEIAPHLVRYEYIEPTWRRDQGRVVATVIKRLFGLKLGERGGVDFASADPAAARELFILHALVLGELDVADSNLAANQALLEEAEALEHRLRRTDIRPSDEVLAGLYRQALPAEVCSAGTFRRWRKRAGSETLAFGRAQLLANEPDARALEAFPDALQLAGTTLPLSYRFAPGADDDGVTVQVPLALLPGLDAAWFEAPVPGLKQEKIMALLRTLPKARRRAAGPLAALAGTALTELGEGAGPVLEPLAKLASEATGAAVAPGDLLLDRLPAYLKARFQIIDGDRMLAAGRDLAALARTLGEQAAAARSDSTGHGGQRARYWAFGDLDDDMARDDDTALQAFAALVDRGDEVELRWLASRAQAAAVHADGVLRLARLACERECRHIARKLPDFQRMALLYAPVGTAAELTAELTSATFRSVLGEAAAQT
ncbi:MAG: ATP-dependent RNA helicase HrpA, partial [Gammaproteobacteria bacterium]|nr:ATP-dependent RNA helicase HrpA [Gammaproteobacteria bacterium]